VRKPLGKSDAITCDHCGQTGQLYEVRSPEPTVWDDLCVRCIRKELRRWQRAVDDLNEVSK
jgi:hypothetical protein